MKVHIIGAGLAGAEAAWQVAKQGIPVVLYEMRPKQQTPAHQTGHFAELVCSNSLKSNSVTNAAGLLKEELRRLDSLIMTVADANTVPAGQALAVDRDLFAAEVTAKLHAHPLVTIMNEEVKTLPTPSDEPWIVATGPLTSPGLASALADITGKEYLYFFDAAAPIIALDSLNLDIIFRASRYDKGDADYLNCPMDKDQYFSFLRALQSAEQHPLHDFEDKKFFEGCMPVEELAVRGDLTLAHGPLKPVGLSDPRHPEKHFAVVQLRQDNVGGDLYNMVGFQTNLRFGEQERVFRLIPGMEKAQFARYGVMHRNLFLNSPQLLLETLQMKTRHDLFFAGQITGVEGYIESAATGWLAGLNAARLCLGKTLLTMPRETMLGALTYYVSHADTKHFQPMNAVFGIMPPLENGKIPKKVKQQYYADRALASLSDWQQTY